MAINRSRVFQLFKYTVYALLAFNIYWFFAEEWAASAHRFGDSVALKAVIEGFAATIDTTAWVVLLLMFELETHVLEDRHFTRRVTWALHGLRIICYTFIIYAFYGYVTKLLFLFGATPVPGLADLCSVINGEMAYAIDLDEYRVINVANCQTLSAANSFLQLPEISALVDQAGIVEIVRLAWVDVINSGVWLLVVFVLEVDVRLQERNILTGTPLRISQTSKYFLYSALLMAAIYWGIKGDFVDFWDAFLWLVAFVFIELNVFDWRNEAKEEVAPAMNAPI